jgi:hypothetical protein
MRVIGALVNPQQGGPFMASSSRKKTTMAKLNREAAVRERRVRKRAKKEARKQASMAEPGEASIGEQEQASIAQLEEPSIAHPGQAPEARNDDVR